MIGLKEQPLKPSRKGFVTNYPPFAHWKKEHLDEARAEKPLVIYVHIPFCAQQCSYCHYVTQTGTRKSEIDSYVDALCKEIELGSNQYALKNRPVVSLYLGGGTPTLLHEKHLHQIKEALDRHLSIGDHEFCVEAEPVTLTTKKANILKDLGVNRISMGVQSLCDDIIQKTNRHDTEAKAIEAIATAKETGAVVNIDLMSGLAGEVPETWEYSVKRALESEVESITIYKTELYANTEYFMGLRKKTIDLPNDDQEIEFMQYAIDQMNGANYLPWSFFTFTKDGLHESAYAVKTWSGTDCFSFGVSAFGSMDNWLYQNTNDIARYIAEIEEGELPMNRGYVLSSQEQMMKTVLLGMKMISLDLTQFKKKYGFSLQALCGPTLERLQAEDYIQVTDTEVTKTAKGILYGDYTGRCLANSLKALG